MTTFSNDRMKIGNYQNILGLNRKRKKRINSIEERGEKAQSMCAIYIS